MMMPSMSPSSSSHPGAVSSSSAILRVEKATSEFLIGPDWTMNIDICDTLNSNHWLAKDVVKAVKKRLLHKNPQVQLLSLTLLETMVKNCGDYVHFQIADRNILQEMLKIVKKKADMHVRDKILVLLDSWQEAFGGPGGKYPQYYWAYEELRRMGVGFPERSLDAAPIFTPPMTHPPIRHLQPGYGMPNNSSTRLDEAMAAEMETLSLSSISSMRNVLDLLADMLQVANPNDRLAVKDEVIIDLVERCRSNQKKLMQMLTTTGDEELLARGLELNDNLQAVLAKHDAIASGLPLPARMNPNLQLNDKNYSTLKPANNSILKQANAATPSRASNDDPLPLVPITRCEIDEEEEEEDDFALLARRHSKTQSSASQAASMQNSEGDATLSHVSNTNSQESSSTFVVNNALVLADSPVPVGTTKEQDIIDLLSITLSTTTSSPETAQAPNTPSKQNLHEGTALSGQHNNNSGASQAYLGNQTQAFNSYVAPWALPQQQFQPSGQGELVRNPEKLPAQQYPLYYNLAAHQSEVAQARPTHSQYAYPPPPWAATPGYFSNPNTVARPSYTYSSPQATSMIPSQGTRAAQHLNPAPVVGSTVSTLTGDARVGSGNVAHVGQKPFIPSYRLFEDLNVLGNSDRRSKMTSNSSSLSGNQNQSMVRGGK